MTPVPQRPATPTANEKPAHGFGEFTATRLVILVQGLVVAFFAITMDAPGLVILSVLILDTIAVILLFRVDWGFYWFTLPHRLRRGMHGLGLTSGLALLGFAASILVGWFGTVAWHAQQYLVAMLLFLLATAGILGTLSGGIGFLIGSIGTLLFNEKIEPDGRGMVEGQDVHGAADFATKASVDQALKGATPSPFPTRFED